MQSRCFMRVYSLTKQLYEFVPLEVEISFMPGLPRFHIMGLPDIAIRESQARIKSALRHQGFKLPRYQQVLVNLKPLHLKKSSQGLDLAIACAYLWASKQVPLPEVSLDKICIYGELSLAGEIQVPEDFEDLDEMKENHFILSAPPSSTTRWNWLGAKKLQDLESLEKITPQEESCEFTRPSLDDNVHFKLAQAHLMTVVGTGEHSLCIAGPAGSGKTTLVKNTHRILSNPSPCRYRESRKMARSMGLQESWRPLVVPHHSIPVMSMVGGGSPPVPGEISRAHGGVLLLDEFLEFHTYVRESLREPMESKNITVARRGQICHFPANFILMATTNLCPCGNYVPANPTRCHFTISRCRSYLDKLSGPLLDRFAILAMSHQWKGDLIVPIKEIRERVAQAQDFARKTRGQISPNADLDIKSLETFVDKFVIENLLPSFEGSQRRKKALFQVARSLADLKKQEKIPMETLNEAMDLCVRPFSDLKFGVT